MLAVHCNETRYQPLLIVLQPSRLARKRKREANDCKVIEKGILGEVHIDRCGNDPIIPRICPITYVAWSSTTDIINHAFEIVYFIPFRSAFAPDTLWQGNSSWVMVILERQCAVATVLLRKLGRGKQLGPRWQRHSAIQQETYSPLR